MNRQQRRARAKLIQESREGIASAAGLIGIPELFATAVHHHQEGKTATAQALYRKILSIDPQHVDSLNNLGVIAYQAGQNNAADFLSRAVAIEPSADVYTNLGNAYQAQSKLDQAISAYRQGLALDPEFAKAHYNLGLSLCLSHQIDEAFSSFTRAAELKYRKFCESTMPFVSSPHKTKHDREQLAHLMEMGGADAALKDIAAAPASDFDSLFHRFHHIEGGDRVSFAINPNIASTDIESRWAQSRPKLVVVDELLTLDALAALRDYCWGSTFWRTSHESGYLAATRETGFTGPIVAQIANELRAKLPGIFRDYPLTHCWAFKYDSKQRGVSVHADFAAVNVNFWITEDEANLDPSSGGLVVWDQLAPLDWSFAKFNADTEKIRAFLARTRANSIVVPHRANRAVVFDSDLFHETDRIQFKEGYRNRRINITMLFGLRTKRAS